MSVNRLIVDARPEDVFAVLMEAYAYPSWVIGAKRIRAVDPEWPAVGSRFHHAVGAPGVEIDDSSKLLEVEVDRRVVLEVRIRPIGVGIVEIDLAAGPQDGTTQVVMTERATRGPLRRWWSWPLDRATWVRNWLSLRLLARLSRRRYVASA
jgi:hypothetical protein